MPLKWTKYDYVQGNRMNSMLKKVLYLPWVLFLFGVAALLTILEVVFRESRRVSAFNNHDTPWDGALPLGRGELYPPGDIRCQTELPGGVGGTWGGAWNVIVYSPLSIGSIGCVEIVRGKTPLSIMDSVFLLRGSPQKSARCLSRMRAR